MNIPDKLREGMVLYVAHCDTSFLFPFSRATGISGVWRGGFFFKLGNSGTAGCMMRQRVIVNVE